MEQWKSFVIYIFLTNIIIIPILYVIYSYYNYLFVVFILITLLTNCQAIFLCVFIARRYEIDSNQTHIKRFNNFLKETFSLMSDEEAKVLSESLRDIVIPSMVRKAKRMKDAMEKKKFDAKDLEEFV